MAFPKVLTHPNKDMIVKLLTDGKGVRYVSKVLKEMYPEEPSKRISVQTLQAFRKEHLKLEGDVLEDIKKTKRLKERKRESKKEHTLVKHLPSYKRKLEEVADMHLDIRTSLAQVDTLIKARLENFFDMAQAGQATRDDEKLLQGYFDRYFTVIQHWAKYVENMADQRIDHNINVTVVNEQMDMLRTAVVRVLQRMDPQEALKFMEELDKEMNSLSYRPDGAPSLQELSVGALQIASAEDAEVS